jgi:T5SS/PEP-CTERM-associated repeat protein
LTASLSGASATTGPAPSISAASATVTIADTDAPGPAVVAATWIGSNGNYNDSNNWDNGAVPVNDAITFFDVFIDGGDGADSAVTVDDGNRTIDNLTISAGDSMFIDPGAILNVSSNPERVGEEGVVTNNGGTLRITGTNETPGSLNAVNLTQTSGLTSVLAAGVLAANGVDIFGGILNGTGEVQGNVTVSGAGARLAPGESVGTLTIDGFLQLFDGQTLEIEVDNTGNDQLIVSGLVTLDGTLDVIFDDPGASAGDEFLIIDGANSIIILNLALNDLNTLDDFTFTTRVDEVNNDLFLVVNFDDLIVAGDPVVINDPVNPTNVGSLQVGGPGTSGSLTLTNGTVLNATAGSFVGSDGTGFFRVEGGAMAFFDSNGFDNLDVGLGPTSDGTVEVAGAGSSISTTGTDNTIQVGRDSTGVITVFAGATVNTLQLEAGRFGTGTINIEGGTVIVSNDTGIFAPPYELYGGFVRAGRELGGDGTINVTDGGQLLVSAGDGQSNPGIQIARNIDGTGTILVDGATSLISITQTGPTFPAQNVFGPFLTVGTGGTALFTMSNDAQVLLSGDDSNVSVGRLSGSNGTFEILSGADLSLNGNDVFASLQIGRFAGSTGTMRINGAGSTAILAGTDNVVHVGREGAGTLLLESSALVSTLSFQLGQGATGDGTLMMTGGSTIIASNDGGRFSDPYDYEAGFARFSRDGTSTVSILEGSRLEVRAGEGVNEDTVAPFFDMARNAGSFATATIDGAGSIIDIFSLNSGVGDFGGTTSGLIGRFGTAEMTVSDGGTFRVSGEQAFFGMGRNAGGSGTMTVTDAGSSLIVDALDVGGFAFVGNEGVGVLNVLAGASATLDVGSFNVGENVSGNGTVLVDGAGSSLTMTTATDSGSNFVVGSEGVGALNVLNGAEVAIQSQFFNVGGAVQGNGTILVDGAGSTLNVTSESGFFGFEGTGSITVQGGGTFNHIEGSPTGSNVDIGGVGGSSGTANVNAGGTFNVEGFLTVASGFLGGGFGVDAPTFGTLNINGGTVSSAGAIIGGLERGNGTVLVDGGTWNNSAGFTIGDSGTAVLTIVNGGLMATDFGVVIGNTVGSSGTANIGAFDDPGNAGTFTVGETMVIGHGDIANAATVSGTVNVSADGTLAVTDNINVEDGGVLNVETGGTVNGTVNLLGGTQNTGLSPGMADIQGDYIVNAGALNTEFAGTGAGQFDLVQVSGQASLFGGLLAFSMIEGYDSAAGDSFAFLTADGGLTAQQGDISVSVSGVTLGFDFALDFGANEALFTVLNDTGAGTSSLFYGGSGDDVFIGGDGDDLLSGGLGSDHLTGGAGSDIFALGTGDSLSPGDVFSDFEDGSDLIGLEGGLAYGDLLIQDGVSGAEIAHQGSGELLAVLDGITASVLNQDDFVAMA